ncbi:MAG: hypothetical protein WC046_01670 [Candidatus Bathyarchaeia archaeon]
MALAYSADAKYEVTFNYPNLTSSNYGILEEEYFEALQHFWSFLHYNPESIRPIHQRMPYILPDVTGLAFGV